MNKQNASSNFIINLHDIFLKQTPLDKTNTTGIYFLIKGGQVVYIGKTENGISRIFAHKDKDFDSYSFFNVPISDLDWVESVNIIYYQPIYNKQFTSSSFTGLVGLNEKCRARFGSRKMKFIKKALCNLEANNKINIINITKDTKRITLINKNDIPLIINEVEKLITL